MQKLLIQKMEKLLDLWKGKINACVTLTLKITDAKEGIVTLELDDSLAFKGKAIFKRVII